MNDLIIPTRAISQYLAPSVLIKALEYLYATTREEITRKDKEERESIATGFALEFDDNVGLEAAFMQFASGELHLQEAREMYMWARKLVLDATGTKE